MICDLLITLSVALELRILLICGPVTGDGGFLLWEGQGQGQGLGLAHAGPEQLLLTVQPMLLHLFL